MRAVVFRPVDEWKAALMTLPENSYFELMRSIFGNIKTPFNKQRLMDDLVILLSKKEIQEILGAYIDTTDQKIIAAIALLCDPAREELENFFCGEFSPPEAHGILVNLEERFIVYRFPDGEKYRLALNPVLKPVLEPFARDTASLFPSRKMKEKARSGGETHGPDDSFFRALFSFIHEHEGIFSADGNSRKTAPGESKRVFPGFKPETLSRTFTVLGLLRRDAAGKAWLDEERAAAFRNLLPEERRVYFAAGLFLEAEEIIYFQRGRIQALARFIDRFLSTLERDRLYPRLTLQRILIVCEGYIPRPLGRKGGVYPETNTLPKQHTPLLEAGLLTILEKSASGPGSGRLPEAIPAKNNLSITRLLKALEAAGLLVKQGGKLRREEVAPCEREVPVLPEESGPYPALNRGTEFFPPFTIIESETDGNNPRRYSREHSRKYQEHFRTLLLNMKLPKEKQDELAARVDRRMIVREAQLEGASVKSEKLEARGLDYAGKHNIAKQAAALRAALEIVWPGADGKDNTVYGILDGLEKNAGETILVIHTVPEKKEIRLSLAKVSLLRRIKRSIFEE